MPQILGVDIESLVNQSIGSLLLDATLIKKTAGTRTPGSLTSGTNPSTQNFATKGILDEYNEFQIDGTIVQRGDRKILLIGQPLTQAGVTPDPGDQITIEGTTFEIVSTPARDPAAATYICQGRR